MCIAFFLNMEGVSTMRGSSGHCSRDFRKESRELALEMSDTGVGNKKGPSVLRRADLRGRRRVVGL